MTAAVSTDLGALLAIATVPDQNLGVKIAEALLQQHLAACVHLLPAGRSMYRWQGSIEDRAETTLLIKTTTARYAEVEATIKRLHPFDIPEVLALPISRILPEYLDWMRRETH